MEITEELYWSMIESGLGLIAACLPSLPLRSMLGQFSPGPLLDSLRSFFSRSFVQTDSQQLSQGGSKLGSGRDAIHSYPGKLENGVAETYHMIDLEEQIGVPDETHSLSHL